AAAPPEKAKPRKGGSWVQAGAFSSQENAENLMAQLQKRGWPVDTELAQVNGKSVHRVFVGPLSAADVNPYIDILGKMGINARQVTR
ncbi:MAG: SPOR domain-containing protein, partial [Cardiobacterium sp.]